jgi:hypothetical protein
MAPISVGCGPALRQQKEERGSRPKRSRDEASGEIGEAREHVACDETYADHQGLAHQQQHKNMGRLLPE